MLLGEFAGFFRERILQLQIEQATPVWRQGLDEIQRSRIRQEIALPGQCLREPAGKRRGDPHKLGVDEGRRGYAMRDIGKKGPAGRSHQQRGERQPDESLADKAFCKHNQRPNQPAPAGTGIAGLGEPPIKLDG
jgi:hypothetical protein